MVVVVVVERTTSGSSTELASGRCDGGCREGRHGGGYGLCMYYGDGRKFAESQSGSREDSWIY